MYLTLLVVLVLLVLIINMWPNYAFMDNIEVNNVADYLYNKSQNDEVDKEKKPEKVYQQFTDDEIYDLSFSADYSY